MRLIIDGFFNYMSKRLTTEEFIEKAKRVHGDKYDYSLVEYKGAFEKVTIICKKHGLFSLNAHNHTSSKNGCKKCHHEESADRYRSTFKSFVEKSIKLHKGRYKYVDSDYKNNRSMINIICPIHGLFKQRASTHLSGHGCKKCSIEYTSKVKNKGIKIFLKKAKETHGDRYDYSDTVYIKYTLNVDIKCRIHGVFKQTPASHYRGSGCPQCGKISYTRNTRNNPPGWTSSNWERLSKKSKNFDSFKVYVIRCWNDEEEFYKVGRTFKTVKNRFYGKKTMPYNYELIKEYIFDTAKEAFNYENKVKRMNKSHKYIPNIIFGGVNECFNKINV